MTQLSVSLLICWLLTVIWKTFLFGLKFALTSLMKYVIIIIIINITVHYMERCSKRTHCVSLSVSVSIYQSVFLCLSVWIDV